MSTQSKVTSARRKTKPIPASTNVSHIDPKRRKAYDYATWHSELIAFLKSLSDHKLDIAKRMMVVIVKKPSKTKKRESGEVIQFPSIKNQSKSAMEA